MKKDKHLDWFRLTSRFKRKEELRNMLEDEFGLRKPRLPKGQTQLEDIRKIIDEFFEKAEKTEEDFAEDQIFKNVPNPGYGKFAEDEHRFQVSQMA